MTAKRMRWLPVLLLGTAIALLAVLSQSRRDAGSGSGTLEATPSQSDDRIADAWEEFSPTRPATNPEASPPVRVEVEPSTLFITVNDRDGAPVHKALVTISTVDSAQRWRELPHALKVTSSPYQFEAVTDAEGRVAIPATTLSTLAFPAYVWASHAERTASWLELADEEDTRTKHKTLTLGPARTLDVHVSTNGYSGDHRALIVQRISEHIQPVNWGKARDQDLPASLRAQKALVRRFDLEVASTVRACQFSFETTLIAMTASEVSEPRIAVPSRRRLELALSPACYLSGVSRCPEGAKGDQCLILVNHSTDQGDRVASEFSVTEGSEFGPIAIPAPENGKLVVTSRPSCGTPGLSIPTVAMRGAYPLSPYGTAVETTG